MAPAISQNGCKRVAICGKGGTGKTAFTAMMCRALVDSGAAGRLLLIDADPAMGQLSALGISVKRTIGQIREKIISKARSETDGEKAGLGDWIDYMIFEALSETDDFAFLAMGRTETLGCFCPVNALLKEAIESLSRSFDFILIDGEAGLEQINRKIVNHLHSLFIISDPTRRGLETAGMIRKMVEEEQIIDCENLWFVFNRVLGNKEILKQSALDMGFDILGFIPYDEDIAAHDLVGKPIFELPSEAPSLAAVRDIIEKNVIQ